MYDQLTTLDLSPGERAAYEALLTHGPMAPPELARAAGLSRVNGYAALRGLAKAGLAKDKIVNKKQIYSPAPPTKLAELARAKLEQARAQADSIEAIIPALMGHYSLVADQPGISHYEGLEGIKKVYDDTIRQPAPGEILVMRSVYDSGQIEDYVLKYVERRAKLGIKSRLLTPDFKPHLKDEKLLRTRRYLDKKVFSLPTEIDIYGDKVALISLRKDMMATVIQSRDVAETFRIIYELLWQTASPAPLSH